MAKKTKKAVRKVVSKNSSGSDSKSGVMPLADRVLVKRQDMPEKKSVAGIILPDSAQKEKSKLGVVISVGPGRYGEEGDMIPMTVRVGMKVIFNAGWDNEVAMGTDDEEYFLVKESDILAILK